MRANAHRARVLLAVLLVAAIGGGCGDDEPSDIAPGADSVSEASPGDTDGAGDFGDDHPCSLLGTDDLARATGIEFAQGVPNEELSVGDQVVCEWVADSPPATTRVLVTVGLDRFDASQTEAEGIHDDVADIDIPDTDRAYVAAAGSIIGMAIGADFIEVTLVHDTEDATDQNRQLAGIVATKY